MSVPSSFDLKTPLPPRRIVNKLRERLLRKRDQMSGIVAEGRVDLFVPPEQQHHWSPQLIVDIEPHRTSGSILRCRFCSHPHVWALRVGLAAMGAVGLMISICVVCAQYTLGLSPTALFALPLLGLAALSIWGAANRNEARGRAQAKELHQFLEGEVVATEHQEREQLKRSRACFRCNSMSRANYADFVCEKFAYCLSIPLI